MAKIQVTGTRNLKASWIKADEGDKLYVHAKNAEVSHVSIADAKLVLVAIQNISIRETCSTGSLSDSLISGENVTISKLSKLNGNLSVNTTDGSSIKIGELTLDGGTLFLTAGSDIIIKKLILRGGAAAHLKANTITIEETDSNLEDTEGFITVTDSFTVNGKVIK